MPISHSQPGSAVNDRGVFFYVQEPDAYSCFLAFDCRYAIALEIEAASVTSAIYVDGGDPCHSARVVEKGSPSGQDLLIVSGEEHDQGIKPEKYQDAYGRSDRHFFSQSCL